MISIRGGLLGAFAAIAMYALPVGAGNEPETVVQRLLAPPIIKPETGFKATVLVPPGHMYDPGSLVPSGRAIWINDDGGEDGEHGGRIFSVTRAGVVSTLVDIDRLLPIVGFDVAPPSFGAFGGKILALAQPRAGLQGSVENHVILQIDPHSHAPASRVCTLPAHGPVNGGVAGAGAAAHFGPAGSRFAGKFFALTILNGTIYQMSAAGVCEPFVTFDGNPWGAPFDFSFSSDGSRMIVSVSKGNLSFGEQGNFSSEGFERKTLSNLGGAIVAVSPEGAIDAQPLVQGLRRPFSVRVAPASMRQFGGEIFFVDMGEMQVPVPMTQPLKPDGLVYRVSKDGQVHVVAAGFINPGSLLFVDDRTIWISDINGDFIGGRRELPDGFIVKLELQ